ncbi:unnamed protein product, partial [Prorocentrum cordatum]
GGGGGGGEGGGGGGGADGGGGGGGGAAGGGEGGAPRAPSRSCAVSPRGVLSGEGRRAPPWGAPGAPPRGRAAWSGVAREDPGRPGSLAPRKKKNSRRKVCRNVSGPAAAAGAPAPPAPRQQKVAFWGAPVGAPAGEHCVVWRMLVRRPARRWRRAQRCQGRGQRRAGPERGGRARPRGRAAVPRLAFAARWADAQELGGSRADGASGTRALPGRPRGLCRRGPAQMYRAGRPSKAKAGLPGRVKTRKPARWQGLWAELVWRQAGKPLWAPALTQLH